MKKMLSVLIVVLFISNEIISQVVIGKLVDENGAGLAEVYLQLYAAPNVYNATSSSNGTFSFNIITGVEDNQLPTGYSVSDNYPNPFNPSTEITYSIPARSNVSLKVFDLLGSEVAELVKGEIETGTYDITFNASNLPSGVYFYKLQAGNFVETKKMILLK